MVSQTLQINSQDSTFCCPFLYKNKIRKYGNVYFNSFQGEDNLFNIKLMLEEEIIPFISSISFSCNKILWTTIDIKTEINIPVNFFPIKDLYLETVQFFIIFKKPYHYTSIKIEYDFEDKNNLELQGSFIIGNKELSYKNGKIII